MRPPASSLARAAALTLAACSRDPSDAPLRLDVGSSLSACNANELRYLATKHDVRLVFEPCGGNEIGAFAWSPDGRRLAFQLVLSAWVLEADRPDRRTHAVPAPLPSGAGAWLGERRLALPVSGGEGARLAVYDVADEGTGQLRMVDVPGLAELGDLQVGPDDDTALALARAAPGGPWSVEAIRVADGAHAPAFEGRLGAVTSFTWSPAAGLAVAGRGDHVELIDVATGVVVGTWSHATRGVVSPDASRVVLEGPGEPVSLYFQRTWDELPPAAREHELARARAAIDALPPWAPREVAPPTLQIVDRAAGARWTITAFLGDHVAWYDATPGWISLATWGFEGKQLKRNVGLVDLSRRAPAPGEPLPPWGIEPWRAPRPPDAGAR